MVTVFGVDPLTVSQDSHAPDVWTDTATVNGTGAALDVTLMVELCFWPPATVVKASIDLSAITFPVVPPSSTVRETGTRCLVSHRFRRCIHQAPRFRES